MSHPSSQLDDVVHQRTRLGILTVLSEVRVADFAFLRDMCGLTDGNLSSSLTRLEEAGYVAIEKRTERRRSRTWIRLTAAGEAALRAEIRVLKQIVASVEAGSAPPPRHLPPRRAPHPA